MLNTVEYLSRKNNVLFITTSNRWSGEKWWELPKSTQLAYEMQEQIWKQKVTLIDSSKLYIVPCEWNISTESGNVCGVTKAQLHDEIKNPTGYHRCWANINHPEDELWKISTALFECDAVVFFGSIRRWQMNSLYQKLIERLTWIENRVSTLWEESIVSHIDSGIIIVNQNWKGAEVLATQKDVLAFYGFQTPEVLSWNWQFSMDSHEEWQNAYLAAIQKFKETFLKKWWNKK